MSFCSFCGKDKTQKCHVKDKSVFSGSKLHMHNNIILLCKNCHYDYFDCSPGRMALIVETDQLLVLLGDSMDSIVVRPSLNKLVVASEYVNFKNSNCHIFIKTKLRQMGLSALKGQ